MCHIPAPYVRSAALFLKYGAYALTQSETETNQIRSRRWQPSEARGEVCARGYQDSAHCERSKLVQRGVRRGSTRTSDHYLLRSPSGETLETCIDVTLKEPRAGPPGETYGSSSFASLVLEMLIDGRLRVLINFRLCRLQRSFSTSRTLRQSKDSSEQGM